MGLLCPAIVILARSANEMIENNVTSVVILIRTLLVKLASAVYSDGQEQLPKVQHNVNVNETLNTRDPLTCALPVAPIAGTSIS